MSIDSRVLFIGLLTAVGAGRLLEMRLSLRHARTLEGYGLLREPEPGFVAMVVLHTGVLVCAAIEVLVRDRLPPAIVAVGACALFAAANLLRWWVIRTMAGHWNVRVVNSVALGVVSTGPFRWVRHPNYVAVFVELLALPLIHGAYLTALFGAAAHIIVLGRRIALEEAVLFATPRYRALMGGKPRFVPWFVPLPGRARPRLTNGQGLPVQDDRFPTLRDDGAPTWRDQRSPTLPDGPPSFLSGSSTGGPRG